MSSEGRAHLQRMQHESETGALGRDYGGFVVALSAWRGIVCPHSWRRHCVCKYVSGVGVFVRGTP